MAKLRDLHSLGIEVQEQTAEQTELEQDQQMLNNMEEYIQSPPKPLPKKRARKSPKNDPGAAFIQILKVAMYIFSLQVLTYAAAGGAFYLFLQAVTAPSWPKFGISMAFSVVVFLPILYYSKNFR